MAEFNTYKRMLAPPDHLRPVDVPDALVRDKLANGYIIDTAPDTRPQLHASTPGRHKGRPAFIGASGPSMAMYDPADIEAFIRRLGCTVWGCNNAFNVLRGRPLQCDYLVILDQDFWFGHRKELHGYQRAYPACVPCLHFEPMEALEYQRIPINIGDTGDTNPAYQENQYFNGNSSGCAAAQMAMHCGCNPIFLLGHDCTTANGRTHGFGVRSSDELKRGYPQGLQMLAGYETLARHARENGVRVVNLSPCSVLECFEKSTLGDPQWHAEKSRRRPAAEQSASTRPRTASP